MADDAVVDIKGKGTPQAKAPEFSLIPFNDVHPSTATNYAVRGLIPQEGLVLVYGAPKCGKSFWVMDMTLHVALNWPYRSRKVKHGPVVYIACEGVSGITARIEAFRQSKLQDECGHIPFYLIAASLNLINKHIPLVECIKYGIQEKKPPRIVVIDTLNRSLSGDENNSKDMGDYIKAADYVREQLQCAVIIIHHSGYDATHARGHTSLPAAIDAQIAVRRDKERDNAVICTLELMKDGDMGDEIVSRLESLEVGIDDEGDPITSCVVIADDTLPAVQGKQRITGHKKAALELLTIAIEEKGEYPQENRHIPPLTRVVTHDTWREYCYKRMLGDGEKPDTKRRAFNRSAGELVEMGAVKIWDDWVWIP